MTIQKFKKEINKIIKFENSTFDFSAKNYCYNELKEVGKIAAQDIELEGNNLSRIFKLEDGYVVIVDTDEIAYCYFANRVDDAQKLATDKLYEKTVQ